MIAWFTGLGVVAKILLASTVATAAVVSTGAAGVLPGGAQDTFDSVVSVVIPSAVDEEPTDQPTTEPTDEPTTEPTGDADEADHPDNFGGDVSDVAKDKPGTGQEFGKWVSESARAKEKPNDDSTDGTTDDGTTDEGTDGADTDGTDAPGQSGEDHGNKPEGAGNGNGNGNGKP